MNTRNLAILVTLALLGFSVPAAAHPCDRFDDPSHKHCIAETPQTTFRVDMELNDEDDSGPVFCTGTATGRNLGPNFVAQSCRITLDDDMYAGDFCVCGTAVRVTKKKTRVMIFMDDCNTSNFCAGNVWRTEELVGKVKDIGGGDFKIELPSGLHELTKNHEPDKEEPLTEKITIEDIVYLGETAL